MISNNGIRTIVTTEIATGRPICYELDNNLHPIRHYYIDEINEKEA